MVKKLDTIEIYEIAESGNTGSNQRHALETNQTNPTMVII